MINRSRNLKGYIFLLLISIIISSLPDVFSVFAYDASWLWPVPGSYMINSLDRYDIGGMHNQGQCMDIGNNGYTGDVRLDIVSATSGTVIVVVDTYEDRFYNDGSWGNCVIIRYNSYMIVYAHLKSVNVAEGQNVKAGDILGKMGSSGQSTGVHLHMQVYPVGSSSSDTSVSVFDNYIENKEYLPRFRFLKGLESESVKYGSFIKSNYRTLSGSYYTYSAPVIMDSDITISHGALSLDVGKMFSLSCKLVPENSYYTDVTWSSDNSDVAAVDAHGMVTAKKTGNATITVESHSGHTAACHVSVLGHMLTAGGNIYTDVREGDWFFDNVKYMIENKVYYGTSDTTFSPDIVMTRGMFITVLGRMSGDNVSSYDESRFLDVDMTLYYGKYIAWADKNNIAAGIAYDMFEPDTLVTREQMCALIVRYMNYKGYSLPVPSYEPFADDTRISQWAKESVYICKAMGLVSGKGGGYFDPSSGATRAEVATVLALLMHRFS